MKSSTRFSISSAGHAFPDEPLAILVLGHEVAPCPQADDIHVISELGGRSLRARVRRQRRPTAKGSCTDRSRCSGRLPADRPWTMALPECDEQRHRADSHQYAEPRPSERWTSYDQQHADEDRHGRKGPEHQEAEAGDRSQYGPQEELCPRTRAGRSTALGCSASRTHLLPLTSLRRACVGPSTGSRCPSGVRQNLRHRERQHRALRTAVPQRSWWAPPFPDLQMLPSCVSRSFLSATALWSARFRRIIAFVRVLPTRSFM